MGYPVISTWLKVIYDGYFQVWKSLTSAIVRRHIKVTTETDMVHMYQQRQGTRSTKKTPSPKKKTP